MLDLENTEGGDRSRVIRMDNHPPNQLSHPKGLIRHLDKPTWVVVHWWECFTINQRSRVRALGMEKIMLGAPPLNGPWRV
ncbi:hypothetical protein H5410_016419 [Solanum commersonii]|uniref:Uncharacterized protein n=1 Tax=Solanum commersonii TaxID=4109 RepID=A0A9J5ZWZ0_SOLCO|nr:hypothetical protein H5410_016419 [Solanum commersonii]